MKKSTYKIIGAMAGSSMDGLDIALVDFSHGTTGWKFTFIRGETVPYDQVLKEKLEQSPLMTKESQSKLDIEFGNWTATQIIDFGIADVDMLAIHGHTVIHKPDNGISWQLGNGSIIANETKTQTITDFRNKDIHLGGQGAPLVPFGDFQLFGDYDACLNLGGICNVSIKLNQTAWDICPCNQVLNYFSKQLGKEFDKEGLFARIGEFNLDFYNQLSQLDFFLKPPPKSLSNNYIDESLLSEIDPYEGLHTYCHFIARQICENLVGLGSKILITGGGAFNDFLMECIKKELSSWKVVIPGEDIVEYKEAIVFAFLGLKRFKGEVNVLSSATGASEDSCSGVIHLP